MPFCIKQISAKYADRKWKVVSSEKHDGRDDIYREKG